MKRSEDYVKSYVRFLDRLKFEDIPEEVIRFTKFCILDTLGCALGAATDISNTILARFVIDTRSRPESTVFLCGDRTMCAYAALANASMAHTFELDDVTIGHPGTSVVPTALSVAERNGADGKDFITAVLTGYETIARTFRSIVRKRLRTMPIHYPAVTNSIGSAVAAGRLLGLDTVQLQNAIGIAGAVAPIAPFEACSAGGMVKNFYAGWSSFVGVSSGLLAQSGFTSPESLLDGELGLLQILTDQCNLGHMLDSLGEQWMIMQYRRKIHASCGMTHLPLDATLLLVRKYKIAPQDVCDVHVEIGENAIYGVGRKDPRNEVAAKFSLPYLIAVMIAKGREISPDDTAAPNLFNSELLDLSRRVHLEWNTTTGAGSTGKSRVEIITRNGERYSESVGIPKGAPGNPLTERELLSKFETLTSRVLDKTHIKKLSETVLRLDEIDNIRDLVKLLVKKHQ